MTFGRATADRANNNHNNIAHTHTKIERRICIIMSESAQSEHEKKMSRRKRTLKDEEEEIALALIHHEFFMVLALSIHPSLLCVFASYSISLSLARSLHLWDLTSRHHENVCVWHTSVTRERRKQQKYTNRTKRNFVYFFSVVSCENYVCEEAAAAAAATMKNLWRTCATLRASVMFSPLSSTTFV